MNSSHTTKIAADKAIYAPPTTFLRLPEVQRRTGLSRSSIYAAMARGFPRPVKLSERSSAWIESEIDVWIQGRIEAARRAA